MCLGQFLTLFQAVLSGLCGSYVVRLRGTWYLLCYIGPTRRLVRVSARRSLASRTRETNHVSTSLIRYGIRSVDSTRTVTRAKDTGTIRDPMLVRVLSLTVARTSTMLLVLRLDLLGCADRDTNARSRRPARSALRGPAERRPHSPCIRQLLRARRLNSTCTHQSAIARPQIYLC